MEKRLEQIRAESEKTVNASHLDDKTRLEIIAEKSRLITSSVGVRYSTSACSLKFT